MSESGLWNLIQWLHYLGLVMWVGGITFFAGIVAPSVHHSMVSKPLAGELVGKILKRLNLMEVACFVLLLVTSASSLHFVHTSETWLGYLILLVLMMGLVTCFYTFYLTPRMDFLKESFPTLDAVSSHHATKIEFDHLHRIYVKLMSLNLVLGLILLYGSLVVLK